MAARIFSAASTYTAPSPRDPPAKRRRLRKLIAASSKATRLSDLPTDVIANILTHLPPHTHFRLSKTCKTFAAATRDLHHAALRVVDLMPGIAFNAPPPHVPRANPVLDEPHLLELASDTLEEVRLHSGIRPAALNNFLARVSTHSLNVRTLVFTDGGALPKVLVKRLFGRLRKLASLQIHDCGPLTILALSGVGTLRNLSLSRISPASLPVLQTYLEHISARGTKLQSLSLDVLAERDNEKHTHLVKHFLDFFRKCSNAAFPVSERLCLSIQGGGRYMSAFVTSAKRALAAGKSLLPPHVGLELETRPGNTLFFPPQGDGIFTPAHTVICLQRAVKALQTDDMAVLEASLPYATKIVLPSRLWTGRYARLPEETQEAFLELLSRSQAHTLEVQYSLNTIRFCGTPYPHSATFQLLATICRRAPCLRALRISREVVEHVDKTDTVGEFLNALPGGLHTVQLMEPTLANYRHSRFVSCLGSFLGKLADIPALRTVYFEDPSSVFRIDTDAGKILLMGAMRELRGFERSRPDVDVSTGRAILEYWEAAERVLKVQPTDEACPYLG